MILIGNLDSISGVYGLLIEALVYGGKDWFVVLAWKIAMGGRVPDWFSWLSFLGRTLPE